MKKIYNILILAIALLPGCGKHSIFSGRNPGILRVFHSLLNLAADKDKVIAFSGITLP